MLEIEEEYIRSVCDDIIRFKPDLVFTEKGVSGEDCSSSLFNLRSLFLVKKIHLTIRSCTALSCQGKHHCHSPSAKVR
jgi:T-complex protein 1 subunit gamma